MAGDPDWALEALSIARVVFYSIDCATGYMVHSDNCSEILGLPPAGPAASWPSFICADDRVHYETARGKLSPAAPNFEVEYRVQHAHSGEEFWVIDRGSGEFDGGGTLAGIRGAIIDVSARIGVERELRTAAKLRSVVFEAARMAAWHFDISPRHRPAAFRRNAARTGRCHPSR
ncbi:MAG: PAS domain-containing protein [Nitratireductor sp.]|nr:PAS domain-containing protein [Nitratireductor sp.]